MAAFLSPAVGVMNRLSVQGKMLLLAVIGLMQLAVGSRNIGRRRQGDPQAAGWRSNVSLPGRDQTAMMGGG